jgi:hypothetical protein
MSEGQQFSPSSALSADPGHEEDDIGAQQKPFEKRPLDPKKRALLKNLVKKNTLCHLMFEAHEKMSHRGLPKEVIAIEMHKRLDKLEDNDKTSFAVIMANTNSSVHARGANSKDDMKDVAPGDDSKEDKYSESYWAEII